MNILPINIIPTESEITLEGKIINMPLVKSARNVIERAKAAGKRE